MAKPKSDSRTQERHVQAIVRAAEEVELTDFPGVWNKLDTLSTHTYVDGLEVDPAGIILFDRSRFKGSMTIYVVLEYGKGEEGFTTSDSFLGGFEGHFDGTDEPSIDNIWVDVSPFFGGEDVQV